jgi:hypothetical protein
LVINIWLGLLLLCVNRSTERSQQNKDLKIKFWHGGALGFIVQKFNIANSGNLAQTREKTVYVIHAAQSFSTYKNRAI